VIELLNIDCMEYMATLKDGAFDLAIVDPPYGIGSVTYMPCERIDAHGGYIDKYEITVATLGRNQRAKIMQEIVNSKMSATTIRKFEDGNVTPPPEYFRELFRVSKNQVIWGGNYFMLPPSRSFVVLDKCAGEDFSMAMAELAWVSINTNAKIFRKPSMGNGRYKRIHPTQKPPELYKFLLKHFAKPGDRILDTHLGSGTISWACHDMGFDLVGCEIDSDYYRCACERFARHKEQMTLALGDVHAGEAESTQFDFIGNGGKDAGESEA